MKFIFTAILFFLIVGKFLSAQVGVAEAIPEEPGTEENFHSYFFKQFGVLREDVKFDKSKKYDQKDSLELFIADSIRVHNFFKYYHQKFPHACQNRFYKVGFVGIDQEVLIPFEYDWLQPNYDSFLLAKKVNATGIISNRGKVIIPFSHTFYYIHDNSLIAFAYSGADSVILFYDTKGKFLFRVNAYSAKRMSENYVSVSGKNKKFKGIIDINGNWVIEPGVYDNVKWIYDDFICAYKNKMFGVISLKKEMILPFEYDNIFPAENDQFIVYKNRMSGVVDIKNNLVVPLDSVNIKNFGKLYVLCQYRLGLCGLVNSKGERLLEKKYNTNIPWNFEENEFKKINPKSALLITDPETGLLGMYRADGLRILPIEHTYINYKPNGNAIIIGKRADGFRDSLLFAAVDFNGKTLVPFSRNQLRLIDSSPNLLVSQIPNGLAAFVNAKTGEVFTAYEFEGLEPLYPLTNGFVVAKKNWKYALISPDAKVLTDAVYNGFYPVTKENKLWFSEEIVCLGRLNEKLYGITKTGKAVTQKQ